MTDPPQGTPSEPEDELEARLREVIGGEDGPITEDPADQFGRIQQGLDDTGRSLLGELEDADAEFKAKLMALEQRANAARATREEAVSEARRKEDLSRQEARGLGVGMSVAYTILGLPMVGIGIGWLLDRGSEVRFWTGVGALVGAFVGVGMAVYLLNRAQK